MAKPNWPYRAHLRTASAVLHVQRAAPACCWTADDAAALLWAPAPSWGATDAGVPHPARPLLPQTVCAVSLALLSLEAKSPHVNHGGRC